MAWNSKKTINIRKYFYRSLGNNRSDEQLSTVFTVICIELRISHFLLTVGSVKFEKFNNTLIMLLKLIEPNINHLMIYFRCENAFPLFSITFYSNSIEIPLV